jgi:murein DD-endopeptidase MepM/ murein hydrolase activator NlpD
MIDTRSRIDVILGGAAGYLAFTFVILFTTYYIEQRLHAVSAFQAESLASQHQLKHVEKAIPLPEIVENKSAFDLSTWIPKPPLFENNSASLEHHHLLFPLRGIDRHAMTDSFRDPRPGGRTHEGVDILAPRNTPIVAVEDGVIAKLWNSHDGGITIYQFDPTGTYVYYYAHLQSYATGLKEGDQIREGQVIGYVGTSGNAPPNTPHLHFAIYRVTEPGHWYHGIPINPYPILSSVG